MIVQSWLRASTVKAAVRVVVAVMLAITGAIVFDQIGPTKARAACDGAGVPATDFWFNPIINDFHAREESRESCNGNGQYLGKVFDITEDGSCASAQYKDGTYTGVQGTSCDSAGYSYSFWDQTGNTSAIYRVYVNYYTPGYVSTSGY